MSWQQLSVVIGLLTGHLGLYGHLHRIGKDINPLGRRGLNANETVERLLCEYEVGLGGLGVTCSPGDPRFAGSNPAEVDGFFQDVKILSTNPPGGTISWGS